MVIAFVVDHPVFEVGIIIHRELVLFVIGIKLKDGHGSHRVFTAGRPVVKTCLVKGQAPQPANFPWTCGISMVLAISSNGNKCSNQKYNLFHFLNY